MRQQTTNPRGDPRQRQHRAAAASLIGTTIEWYDFFVYSTTAALVLGEVFFPAESTTASLLASFSTFFVAFAARPIGAVLFGHLGDRIGRKRVLVLTLMLMGGATVSIGLIPGHDTWGIYAGLLLVIARIVQGLSVGGEWGGAVLMSVEHADADRKNFLGSWPQWGSPIGLLLSTAVIALATSLPGGMYEQWAWRLPFLLSAALFAVGLIIRLSVEETPDFTETANDTTGSDRAPLTEILTTHRKAVLLMVGAFAYSLGGYYLTTTYTISYLDTELGLASWVGLTGLVVAAIAQLVGSIVGALLADRSPATRRAVMLGSLGVLIVFAFGFFPLVNTENAVVIWCAMGFSQVLQGAFYGPAASLVVQMLPAAVRYTGVSLGYQLSAMSLGATAPFVATLLVAVAGGSTLLTLYLVFMAVTSFVTVSYSLKYVGANNSGGSA